LKLSINKELNGDDEDEDGDRWTVTNKGKIRQIAFSHKFKLF
jgi:hypothetical protein